MKISKEAIPVLIFFIFFPSAVNALDKQGNMFILDNTIETIAVNDNIDILLDDKNEITPEKLISNNYLNKFSHFNKKNVPFFKNYYVYWIRLRVKNAADEDIEWVLTDKIFPVYGKVTAYIETDNLIREIDPYTKFNNKFYKLNLIKDTVYTIYLKYSYVNLLFDLQFINLRAFIRESTANHLFIGFFIGIVLIMTLYNLFIFFSFRDKSYLYFTFFSLILSFSQLIGYGIFNELSFNINELDMIYSILRNLSIIFFALYSSEFLSLRIKSPKVNKILFSNIIFLAGSIISTPFYYFIQKDSLLAAGFKIIFIINLLSYIVIFITSLIISIRLWLRGNKPARYFIIAAFSIILTVVIYSFAAVSPALLTFLTNLKIIDYAILIMILLFSLAAADRINLVRKEKEQAQEQIIKNLLWIKEVTKTNDSLNRAYELKSQLMSTAAHDLKNPLATIIGGIDVLKKRMNFDKGNDRFIEIINKSTIKMNTLISELLEDSMIEDGKIVIKKETVNLVEITKNIISNYKLQLSQKNQTIIFRKKTGQYLITADKMRVAEIIDNLVSNAIKYSPVNRKIRILLEKINNERKRGFVVIKVIDEGPGLTDNDKIKIFRKFQKLSARPTGGEISTGLGLSITKYLVELHKGKITVVSEHGKGAAFSVKLPIANDI